MSRPEQQRKLEKNFQESLFGIARQNGRGVAIGASGGGVRSCGPVQIEPRENPFDGMDDSREEKADYYVVVDEGDVEGVAAMEGGHLYDVMMR